MEYTICKYCDKPFIRNNKLQKYHKKCREKAIKESIKKYYSSDEVRDRSNYNSLINRLNKREETYKKENEIRYILALIILKKISIERAREIEKEGDYYKDYSKKEIVMALRMKESIEKAKIFNDKKIEILNNLEDINLKKRLKKLGGFNLLKEKESLIRDRYLTNNLNKKNKKLKKNKVNFYNKSLNEKECRECGLTKKLDNLRTRICSECKERIMKEVYQEIGIKT